ncbi:hypothetical protein GCM10010124_26110 [Pilimelia terevasa]|uniref:Uncharacterized protein n=1 Tax=Pilimelia terevasa TaxID=53372 RepID=A0A8J3FI58_9ACTN|nr:hypothetical protein [Pilimelia terevasa]GGK32122.1 hypothetical protein GCM10010124_26110 [Pilimelia terevasa]
MAEGLSATAANDALDDSILATYTWIKLHVGAPGAAGTSNPATETDRVQATWAPASGGASSNSNTLTWSAVAGAEDYTYFTAWTASTAGTFGFSGTVTANAVGVGDDFTVAIGGLDVSLPVAS